MFQRPQQLMTRLAERYRVMFWEEPQFDSATPRVDRHDDPRGVEVLVPHLSPGTSASDADDQIAGLLTEALAKARRLRCAGIILR